MKNIFKSLMLVAVAAMGFTACQNEGVEEAVRPNEPAEVVMTITADVDATRTWIDEANGKVQWSEGDALKVIENSKNYRTTTNTTITDGKAKFTVSFAEDTTSESFTYNAVYPATAVVEDEDNVNNAKVKVVLKDAQKPTATSFDPTADILVSKQIVADAQPTELNMQFKRLVAIGKMTITNLDNDAQISKVTFTAPEGKVLAGRNYVDATTGVVSEYGYFGATNVLTLSYDEAIATRDIYFTCNPFEMAGGDVFSVEIVCGDYTYTREVTIPAERSLAFTEGDLTTFTVNMADATKVERFVFPDGEYAVLAHNGGKYYALSCTNSINSKRLDSVDEVTYTGSGAFVTNDDNLKWTIAYTEDKGYTFKGANDQYIAWYGNDNYAKTQAEAYYLDITKDGTTGRYIVTSKEDATRKLQRNNQAGNKYFAFYTTSQWGSLAIVPVKADTAPRFEVTPNAEQSIVAAGGDIRFTVTTYNGAVVLATSSDTTWLTIDNTFKATAIENTSEEGRSATITFSAEGCDSVIVNVSQKAKSTGGGEETTGEDITLDFTSVTNNVSSYEKTWKQTCGNYTWDMVNFNNNNGSWDYVKCGRKNYTSVASINTTFSIPWDVSSVVVTIDAVTTSKVNSTYLVVASDASFSNIIETVNVSIAKGDLTYTIENPGANYYYKLVYDCASGSNGLIQISKVVYKAN